MAKPEHPSDNAVRGRRVSSAANVYLVKTKDQRTYTEPIMDDGSGPSFYCWPMAPVVAETPGKAKKLFLDAFAQGARTGVETDDYPNLRVTTLAKGVERPVGVYADDDELWKLVSHA